MGVNLSVDAPGSRNAPHPIERCDSLDITFTPRPFSAYGVRSAPMTPREQMLSDGLELPIMHTYPVPPDCGPDQNEAHRQAILLQMYREFALELHAGMYLKQMTSESDYSDIHCQLMDDMQTLKLDQSTGCIIEFPLTGVSKVYRIVKSNDKWYSVGSTLPSDTAANMEHVVVVEFMRRKLAFIFRKLTESQRFLICMELLIRRAQQEQARNATPAPSFANNLARGGNSMQRAVASPGTSASPGGAMSSPDKALLQSNR